MALIGERVRPERRERTFSRAMAYESAADETAFVIGPFVVGVLAALIAPWAPIVGAAVLSFVFVTAFALHPTGRAVPARAERAEMAPARELLRPRLIVLVAAVFRGRPVLRLDADLAHGLHGGPGRPRSGSPALRRDGRRFGRARAGRGAAARGVRARWRLVAFAAILAASAGAYTVGGSVVTVTVVLCVMGIGVGPSLVTVFSLAGSARAARRSASTMTLLASALTLAQALSSAITGAGRRERLGRGRDAPARRRGRSRARDRGAQRRRDTTMGCRHGDRVSRPLATLSA